ncbi:unnamed protein product, partial [marine sediment metagenome]
ASKSCSITVERPLRLNFLASPERIARLDEQTAFQNLAKSKKRNPKEKSAEEELGRQQQEALKQILAELAETLYKDREQFEEAFDKVINSAGPLDPLPKINATLRKAILNALSERDETASICRDKDGHPEADRELRDNENIPLGQDIWDYFDSEVKPHIDDAWVDKGVLDHKDIEIGKVGYEINFNRYFYQYEPHRPLEEIEADIKSLESEIVDMLREVTG